MRAEILNLWSSDLRFENLDRGSEFDNSDDAILNLQSAGLRIETLRPPMRNILNVAQVAFSNFL